jgi:uncharacterized protein with FMN-binding domain
MRRAAAVVFGTLTGTALLVAAKYGSTPSTTSSPDVAGVVVAGPAEVPGSAPATGAASLSPAATAGLPGTANSTRPPTSTQPSAKGTTTPPPPPPPSSGLKNGTYKASAAVSSGQGTLSMTVTISGGKITAIAATEGGGETNCYHSACTTLTPEALSAQSANVASVSGATHTSSAFKSALSAVLASAKA